MRTWVTYSNSLLALLLRADDVSCAATTRHYQLFDRIAMICMDRPEVTVNEGVVSDTNVGLEGCRMVGREVIQPRSSNEVHRPMSGPCIDPRSRAKRCGGCP